MQITVSSRIFAGTFAYYKDGSTRSPAHSDPCVADLNGDGVDEVIFGGFETQPNTPAEFSPITLHVFGWKDGAFQDLSSQWLPNKAGDVQGIGSMEFADFNGDGTTDIFMSAYADMSDQFSPYVLYNRGGWFEKAALPVTEALQHGTGKGDINSDGYTDVFATGYGSGGNGGGAPCIYLGGAAGLKAVPFTNFAGGSDVVLGDFLGDGTLTAVISDYWQSDADTMLAKMRISADGATATLDEIALLPIPLLENPKTPAEESHDVRIQAVDFNNDGLLDLVVYSRLNYDGTQWPNVSAVQFLQNQGKGIFSDVTAAKLQGYVSTSMIPYAPVVRDLNQDGYIDFYVDGASFGVAHNSASLLMQDTSGQFVDTARNQLSSQVADAGGISTVALGPDGNFHLIALNVQNGQGIVYSQTLEFPERNLSEHLTGTALADTIYGKGGNDTITAGLGNDMLDGGNGIDTSVYIHNANHYTVTTLTNGRMTVNGDEGVDQLVNIERLQYADKTVALDLDANAGEVAKTLGAVFGKAALANKEYAGIGLHFVDDLSYSYTDLMQLAIYARLGANPTPGQVVDLLYTNVVGSAPDAATRKSFTDLLDNHTFTEASLGVLAADTDLNKSNINLMGLTQTGLEYSPFSG